MNSEFEKEKRSNEIINDQMSAYSDSENDSLPEIECKVCNKSFWNTHSYEQHVNSKKHYNQLTKKKMVHRSKSENKLSTDDNDDSNSEFTELICEICSMVFSGYKPYNAHLKGSVHAKYLKKHDLKEKLQEQSGLKSDESGEDEFIPKPVARCLLCDKEFSGFECFNQHLKSVNHKKKLQNQKILTSLKLDHENADMHADEDFFKRCDICDKSFSGLQSYHIHMKSLIHQKALKKIEVEKSLEGLYTKGSDEDGKFICKVCDKPFKDPLGFKAHMDNNSHQKHEAKKKIMNFVNVNPDIIASKTVSASLSEGDDDDDNKYQIGNYILVCKICHMSFSGPESALSHLKSKKHLKFKEEKEKIKFLIHNQNLSVTDSKSVHVNEVNGKSQAKNTARITKPTKKENINNVEGNEDFELI